MPCPRPIVVAVATLIISFAVHAQAARGTVREGLTIESEILKRAVRYSVYLPFDYESSVRYYPAVFLLHGGGGDESSWVELEAGMTADELIAAREIPPMVLIMPDAGTSRYVNSLDGTVPYEDFFFRELIPAMEAKYRIRPDKWHRAVAGFSMGGYASVVYALRHPDAFLAAAGLSAAIYTDDMTLAMTQEQWDQGRGAAFGTGLRGTDRLSAHYRQYDPLTIVRDAPAEQKKYPRLYLDCGDDDVRNDGNAALHVLLRNAHIPHEYRVRDGGHTLTYWRVGLREVLRFIGDTFREPL